MDLGLKGKSVLITGGSKGIGLACAMSFAAEGCELHLAARNRELLEAERRTIREAHGVDVSLHAVDLRERAALHDLANACADSDILVNNAGDIPGGTIESLAENQWRHAWELKVFGYINLTRALFGRMKARKRGVIVNVIGMAAETRASSTSAAPPPTPGWRPSPRAWARARASTACACSACTRPIRAPSASSPS